MNPMACLHTVSLPQLRSEIATAGFERDRIQEFLPIQHGPVFLQKTVTAKALPMINLRHVTERYMQLETCWRAQGGVELFLKTE
jgi:hypothetical protein